MTNQDTHHVPLKVLNSMSFDPDRFNSPLKGIGKGDRVAVYLPVTIELVIAMLACARIGAIHSVVVSSPRNFRFLVKPLS